MVHIWVVLNFAHIDGAADYKMKCHHHQHHRHLHTGQDASSSDRDSSKKQTWQTLSENAKKEQPRNGSNIMLNKSLIYFWFERGFWFLSRIDRTPHPLSATKFPVLSLTGGRATSVFGGGLAWLRWYGLVATFNISGKSECPTKGFKWNFWEMFACSDYYREESIWEFKEIIMELDMHFNLCMYVRDFRKNWRENKQRATKVNIRKLKWSQTVRNLARKVSLHKYSLM